MSRRDREIEIHPSRPPPGRSKKRPHAVAADRPRRGLGVYFAAAPHQKDGGFLIFKALN